MYNCNKYSCRPQSLAAAAYLLVSKQSSTTAHARLIAPGLSCFSFSSSQTDWKLELSILLLLLLCSLDHVTAVADPACCSCYC